MKAIRVLTKSIEKISTILFIIMTLITFIQVITRYFMGISFFWAEELGRFAMIWIAFLGAAVGVSQKAHTRIDFFINLLPRSIKKWVEVLDNLICLAFISILVYYSLPIIQLTMKNVSAGLKIPMGIIYGSLPVSGIFMILYFLIQIYYEIKEIDVEGGAE